MLISKFSGENWQENQNKRLLQPPQSWQDIETAITELDLDRVLKAAKTFSDLGLMEKSVIWEQDRVFEPV